MVELEVPIVVFSLVTVGAALAGASGCDWRCRRGRGVLVGGESVWIWEGGVMWIRESMWSFS